MKINIITDSIASTFFKNTNFLGIIESIVRDKNKTHCEENKPTILQTV